MALSSGLKVEGSSASSSCLAETVAVCADALAAFSGRQSVHVGSGLGVSDIVCVGVAGEWQRCEVEMSLTIVFTTRSGFRAGFRL